MKKGGCRVEQKVAIGRKIKELRRAKRLTLKDLSEKTGLSMGFLSQLERGLSAIAIDSLSKIAAILNTELSVFINNNDQPSTDAAMRFFEQEHTQVASGVIQSILSKNVNGFNILPRLIQLLPSQSLQGNEKPMYAHEGEEFAYVLEGVLTLQLADKEYILCPGDSIQIDSTIEHNWFNHTNAITKLLTINVPNPFIGHDCAAVAKQKCSQKI